MRRGTRSPAPARPLTPRPPGPRRPRRATRPPQGSAGLWAGEREGVLERVLGQNSGKGVLLPLDDTVSSRPREAAGCAKFNTKYDSGLLPPLGRRRRFARALPTAGLSLGICSRNRGALSRERPLPAAVWSSTLMAQGYLPSYPTAPLAGVSKGGGDAGVWDRSEGQLCL